MQNRLETNRQPRTLVTNSYIEGDVDIVSGRGAVVFDNTEFRVVNSRTQQEAYVFRNRLRCPTFTTVSSP